MSEGEATAMEAGRALDERVAREVMGLEVLGWHPCVFYEGPMLSPRTSFGNPHPVYLNHCCCKFVEGEPFEGEDAFLINGGPHNWHCGDVVSFYSTDPAADYEVLRHVREKWTGMPVLRFAKALRDIWSERKPVADMLCNDADLVLRYTVGDYARAALAAVAAAGGKGQGQGRE